MKSEEQLVVNNNFNREFAQLINKSTKEIEDIFCFLSADSYNNSGIVDLVELIHSISIDSLEARSREEAALNRMNPQKKMALVLMYYTGRDSISTYFESNEARTAWFQQELYLNYEAYFLKSGKPGEHKSISLEMDDFTTNMANQEFHILCCSALTIYCILKCLTALSKDLKGVCNFDCLMVHQSYHPNKYTMESMREFDKVYDADIRLTKTLV